MLPYKYRNDEFSLSGQFCGWPCVKAYNIHSNNPNSGRISDLITLYRKRVTGSTSSIQSAPSRFVLEGFGGTVSIDDFRNGSTATVKFPFTPSWVILPNAKIVKQVVDQSSDELVLKRNKPLRRDISGIQKMLLKK
jgi:hypothetical protein